MSGALRPVHSDGKQSNVVSIVTWKYGQLLVWDATSPDTFVPSYCTIAAQQAGAVAEQAEVNIQRKYNNLDFFTPLAIETAEVFRPRTMFKTGVG